MPGRTWCWCPGASGPPPMTSPPSVRRGGRRSPAGGKCRGAGALETRFARRGIVLTPNNRRQVWSPKGAASSSTRMEARPCFACSWAGRRSSSSPASRGSTAHLVDAEVLPRHRRLRTERADAGFLAFRLLRTVGLPESHLDAKVAPVPPTTRGHLRLPHARAGEPPQADGARAHRGRGGCGPRCGGGGQPRGAGGATSSGPGRRAHGRGGRAAAQRPADGGPGGELHRWTDRRLADLHSRGERLFPGARWCTPTP